MATTFGITINKKVVTLGTRFWGGDARGTCFQYNEGMEKKIKSLPDETIVVSEIEKDMTLGEFKELVSTYRLVPENDYNTPRSVYVDFKNN